MKIDIDTSKDDILRILNESERIPTGGLLISGDWGTGKTYFWDKEIYPNISIEKVPRISIAGLSSSESVYKAIVTSKYIHSIESLTCEDWKRYLKLILSFENGKRNLKLWIKMFIDWVYGRKRFIINVLKKAGLDHSQFSPVKALLRSVPWAELIPKNAVICLDDVERKSLPSIELLGLVIFLTETKNCKLVIIANESNLDKKFKRHKEKMIWKSFTPKASLDKVFASFVEKYASASHVDSIKSYRNEIVLPFKRGVTNLRVFSRCIQEVESIIIAAKYNIPPKYIRFYCSLKVWQSEKNGELKSRSAYSYGSWYSISFSSQTENKPTADEEEGRDFYEKFWNPNEDVGESDSLYEFAKTGVLDVEKILSELGPINNVSQIRILANEIREQNWFFMTDDVNREKVGHVERVLSENITDDPALLLQISGNTFRICEHSGIDFPSSLIKVIETGLENLASKGVMLEHSWSIDAKTKEEKSFLNELVEKYNFTLNNYVKNEVVIDVLGQLDMGIVLNLNIDVNKEYHFSKAVAEALTSEEVLDRLRGIEKTYPDAYYGYFFRATRKIRSIPDIDQSDYREILKSVVDSMAEFDVSSKRRKGHLIKYFNDMS